MATVMDRRARRVERQTTPEFESRPRPRGRWRRRLAVLVVFLLLPAALLPTIVSRTPLAGWIVSQVSADLRGTASVESVRLGWFTPPVLESIEIVDEQSRPLLTVDEIRGERSLLALLTDRSDLGRIHITKPVLAVTYDGTGTNLEEVLGNLLEGEGNALAGIGLELKISDGTLTLTDTRSLKAWNADEFNLTALVPRDEDSPIKVRSDGRIADEWHAGRFSLDVALNRIEGRDDPLSAIDAMEAELENVPLEMLAPLFARSMPGLDIAGRLNAFAKCEVTGGRIQPKMTIQLTTVVDDFTAAGGALGGDRVALDRIEAGGRASWRGRVVDIERFRVQTDLGNALVTGGFDLPDDSLSTLFKSLAEQSYHIEAGVDLARLAEQLPGTLRLQKDIEIESGDARLILRSRRQGEGMRWDGELDISRLAANRQGQQFRWPEPIRATLAVSRNLEGLSIERLECVGKHLRLDVSGTPERIDAALDFRLAGLAEEASQLVDLGALTFSGDGHGQFKWQRQGADQYVADGELTVNDFKITTGKDNGWSEPVVRLVLDARALTKRDSSILPVGKPGQFPEGIELAAGKMQLLIGEDQVTVSLAEPIADLSRAESYAIRWQADGDLARWSDRLQPFVDAGDWQMAGQLAASGRLDWGSGETICSDTKAHVDELVFRNSRLNFYDPEVELTVASGKWRASDRRLEITSATLAGQTVGAVVEPLVVGMSDDGLDELSGGAAIRTTLDRLQQWTTAVVTERPSWMLEGNLVARSSFQTVDGKTDFGGDATIERFVAHHHESGKKFEEPEIRLTALGQYDPVGGELSLAKATIDSTLVGVETGGKLGFGAEAARLELDGTCRYDFVKISELGRTHLGLPIHAAGKRTDPFSYRGPLAAAQGQGRMQLGWTSAELGGFQFGPAEVEAQLADGVARTTPLAVNMSEGRVTLVPQVAFAESGPMLTVEPGRVAEQIRINPRMCEGALQYIAPALAGVTEAQGTFSIELDECRIPLAAPEQGDLSGRMTIHAVSIGPGPLIRELATALGFGRTAQLSRQSVIPFRMVEGRIYHRDLQLVFPEVTMKTYGSVGLDQSLALVVEMPIPDKWRTGNPMIDGAVRNRTIRLPVGGSLNSPVIDRRALEDQAGQFLQGAVGNVINDQINRQLQRLLQPQPPGS